MSETVLSSSETKRLSRKEKNDLLRKQFQVEDDILDDENTNSSPVSALVSSHRLVPLRSQQTEASVELKTPNPIPPIPEIPVAREEDEASKVFAEGKGPRVQGITIYPNDQDALDALMTFAIENKLGVGRAGPSLFYSAGLHAIKELIKSDPAVLRKALRETAEKRGQGDRRIKRTEDRR
jgi:hypothetical protein